MLSNGSISVVIARLVSTITLISVIKQRPSPDQRRERAASPQPPRDHQLWPPWSRALLRHHQDFIFLSFGSSTSPVSGVIYTDYYISPLKWANFCNVALFFQVYLYFDFKWFETAEQVPKVLEDRNAHELTNYHPSLHHARCQVGARREAGLGSRRISYVNI